ncbi:MAG: hypothetical protein K6A44_06780 [bacterium]|nr:hypothetical protein [bacterium]
MIRFFLALILIITDFGTAVAYENYLPPLKNADMWFTQPPKGQKAHDSKFEIMLWRADKWRTSETWRYYPHITSRYYKDCSFYKYVDCKDLRYSSC